MPTTPQTFLQNIDSAGTVIIDGMEYYAASWNGKTVRFLQDVIGEPNYTLKQAGITVRKIFTAGTSPVISNSYVSKSTGKWTFEFDATEAPGGWWYVYPTKADTDVNVSSVPTAVYVEQHAEELSKEANRTEAAANAWDNFFSFKNPLSKAALAVVGIYLGGKVLKAW